MAKSFRCWVIVAGQQPTAFRARDPEELLPTLRQLQRTQPDAALMWFERGRLWPSREDADRARREQRGRRETRGPGWRPGGTHRDPKARPKVPRDRKRELFKKRLVAKKARPGRPAPRSTVDRRRRRGDDES